MNSTFQKTSSTNTYAIHGIYSTHFGICVQRMFQTPLKKIRANFVILILSYIFKKLYSYDIKCTWKNYILNLFIWVMPIDFQLGILTAFPEAQNTTLPAWYYCVFFQIILYFLLSKKWYSFQGLFKFQR